MKQYHYCGLFQVGYGEMAYVDGLWFLDDDQALDIYEIRRWIADGLKGYDAKPEKIALLSLTKLS